VGNPGCPVLKPPRICNPPAAEVALAAVNGQPTAFRRVLISRKGESSKMAYVSDYKLDEPPKCGMKSEVEDVQFKLGWDNHLIGKFAPDINPNRFDMDRRMGVVSGRLQKEKRNHYVLIEAENTGNPDDLANWERRAKLLREDCPALVFMLLSNDNDWMVAETLLLDPFLKLLAEPKETDP
jgi:hypothetical protein